MKHRLEGRPVILFQPGPLHLFWTTGVFYYWELAKKFDFVFLVSSDYERHESFQKIAKLPAVKHVRYLGSGGTLARHFVAAKTIRRLLETYRPRLILLHNRSYVENQYLLTLALKLCPWAVCLYYQNGRMSLDWEGDFALERAIKIESLMARHPRLGRSTRFAGLIVDYKDRLAYLLHYKLLPWMTLRKLFQPTINVFTGEPNLSANMRYSRPLQDFMLAYLDNEIESYERQGVSNVVRVQHPMREAISGVYECLYGKHLEDRSTIIVLPSNGFTSRLIEQGWTRVDVQRHVAGQWCKAIRALRTRFEGFRLELKLHPASKSDPLWQEIVRELLENFPDMVELPASENAEWRIAQSQVIVSDVSTVLWWAALLGGKICISFDIFKYPGGDEFKKYSNIFVVQSLAEVNNIPLDSTSERLLGGHCESVLALATRLNEQSEIRV